MRVLIACEFSGIVRDAFAARGHDAWSCDLLPSERNGKHIQGNVLEILRDGWELMVCGAPSFKKKREDGRQERAIGFFLSLINSTVPRIAVENPVSIMSSAYRKPDQIVEPWYFGDSDSKKICLWLKSLPPLYWGELFGLNPFPQYKWFKSKKTKSGLSRYSNVHEKSKSWRERSRFFQGIANAMANQWG